MPAKKQANNQKKKLPQRTRRAGNGDRINVLKRDAAMYNNPSAEPDTRKYLLALTDPFHPSALGARVPDQFSCPTTTHVVRASLTVTCNSSGNVGAIILPNPITAVALFNGSSADFDTITFGDNTTTTQARWGVDPTSFAQKFDDYRIVGMGVRITALSAMTNSSGKITMGTYPIKANWATKDFPVGGITRATNTLEKIGRFYAALGIPNNSTTNTLYPQQLVNLPGSKVISAMQASENVFQVVPRLADPSGLNFRASGDSLIGWDTAGTAAVMGNADYLDISGFEACYFYYTGGVASTSTVDLEIIYHLEGRMNLSSGISAPDTKNTAVQSSQNSLGVAINPLAATAVQAFAASQQPVTVSSATTDGDSMAPMLKMVGHAAKLASKML